MRCFEHAKLGEIRDAVAVCSNCGVGLCMDHLIEQDKTAPRTNETARSILCFTCANVREGAPKRVDVMPSAH